MTENNHDQQNGQPDKNQSAGDETPIYLTSNSTLQNDAEYREDKEAERPMEKKIMVSRDDLHEIEADRYAGSDRAGTSERKSNVPDDREKELDDLNANKEARESSADPE